MRGKVWCFLGAAVCCRTDYCPSLGLSFFPCIVKWIRWKEHRGLRWASSDSLCLIPASFGWRNSAPSPPFPHSFRRHPASRGEWILAANHGMTEWESSCLSPLGKLQAENESRSLHQIPLHTTSDGGRLLTSLLAPTCHRTCCHMIQSPIFIKVNYPLENECTVNKVISWCLNLKQIASS